MTLKNEFQKQIAKMNAIRPTNRDLSFKMTQLFSRGKLTVADAADEMNTSTDTIAAILYGATDVDAKLYAQFESLYSPQGEGYVDSLRE